MISNRYFSLDLLLVGLLVAVQLFIRSSGLLFLVVLPLFFYVLLELWHPMAAYPSLPEKVDRTRLTFLARLLLIWLIVAGSVIYPAVSDISQRWGREARAVHDPEELFDAHDGAIQIEYALAFLQDGKNPYAERYDDAPFKYINLLGTETMVNPAVYYLAYLPGYIVFSFPFYQLFEAAGLVYDQRWVYLLAYLALLFVLRTLVKAPSLKLALLAAVGLNPLITAPVVLGMNDIVALLTTVIAIAALLRRRFLLSAVAFGLACTFKQWAWFSAPFYFLLLYGALPASGRIKEAVKYAAISVAIAALVILPFALWSLPDFITDVFAFPGGNVEHNYPIRGYTLGLFLVGAGVVDSPLDPFPFWILQLLFGLPLLLWLLYLQRRRNTAGNLFILTATFIFGLGLVSRYFQENHLGYIVALSSIGLLLNLQSSLDEERLSAPYA